MTPNVNILVTCRSKEILRGSTLVFDSLKTGFPTAHVTVYLNNIQDESCKQEIIKACEKAEVQNIIDLKSTTIHHAWIETLVMTENDPFFLLDTDVVFYESFEQFKFDTHLAGALSPEWDDEFTKSITRSRLHTSLLYVDPATVRGLVEEYLSQFPKTEFNPPANLFYPLQLPLRDRSYFHDTCSLLYHAIGGAPFTPRQMDAYFHMHFGTCSDLVLPHLRNAKEMQQAREAVLSNPQLGRSAWRQQQAYYESRKPVFGGKSVIAPITDENASKAREWCVKVCCGNQEAMELCDIAYNYFHGIDDLIDTMQDGRPLMNKEEMISLFFKAALFYNHPFYKKNQAILFPIILQITNTYADSVAWEQSPKAHLRAMGDVFRTCGNEFYIMIALLCGGEKHMRSFSAAIKERDWLMQHDVEGYPT